MVDDHTNAMCSSGVEWPLLKAMGIISQTSVSYFFFKKIPKAVLVSLTN